MASAARRPSPQIVENIGLFEKPCRTMPHVAARFLYRNLYRSNYEKKLHRLSLVLRARRWVRFIGIAWEDFSWDEEGRSYQSFGQAARRRCAGQHGISFLQSRR